METTIKESRKPIHNLRRSLHAGTTEKIYIKSLLITLHSSIAAWALLVCSTTLLIKQSTGPKQICMGDKFYHSNEEFWNRYCSSYVYDSGFHPSLEAYQVSPGVIGLPGENKRQLKFYYIIAEVILFTALLAHIPQMFLKIVENDEAEKIINGIVHQVKASRDSPAKRNMVVRDILHKFQVLITRFWYTIIAEVLCVISLWLSMKVVDLSMNGLFWNFGLEILRYSQIANDQEMADPFIFAFPKVGVCQQKIPQPRGITEDRHLVCLLTENRLYGRIIAMLWLGWMTLATIDTVVLIIKTIVMAFPRLRTYLFQRRFANPWDGERATIKKHMGKMSMVEFTFFYTLSQSITAEETLALLVDYDNDRPNHKDNSLNDSLIDETSV